MKALNKWKNVPITVKVSVAYVICSILQRCISFITMPLFTRLLSTEQYGQYTIYQSWQGILCIFVTLNLAYGSFSTAMIKFENRRDEYISTVQSICVILAVLFLLIYIPFRHVWNKIFELPTGLVLLMLAEIVMNASVLFWSGKKRFEYKYIAVVSVTLLMSIISPLAGYIAVINSIEKGYARIVGCSGAIAVIGGFIFVLNYIRGKKLVNLDFCKYALGFNIPLLAYYLSQVVFNQSDRIMISHMSSTSNAAIYGVAYNLAMILTFVLNAINNSYVPWFYENMKAKTGESNKPVSNVIAIIMALLILFVIWYAPEIISILAGNKYYEAIYVVPPVAMSLFLLFYTQLFINVEFYYEEKRFLVFASIGAALLNVVLNFALIPVFGYVAAGYTTLVSYLAFMFSNYYAMKKVLLLKNSEDNMFDYKSLFIIACLFFVSGTLGVALYQSLMIRIVITLIVCAIVYVYRKRLMEMIKLVRKK